MGAVKEPTASLYDADFVAWIREQVDALRAGRMDRLDVKNLIEEIEDMGKQQRAELVNRLAVLLAHALKWQHQISARVVHGRSWRLTVVEQRRQVARNLSQSPSLKAELPGVLEDAYGDAVLIAARETGLAETAFPEACPFTFEQLMVKDWMPD